jgi:hypothetical protein
MKIRELFEDTKPATWTEIKDTINPGDVDENKVPHHNVKDLWNSSNPTPLDRFDKHPSVEIFILTVGKDTFLISTGGGNYVRTAKRLN